MTDAATPTATSASRALVRIEFPGPAPRAAAPATTADGVALLTIDRPEARNALSFDVLDAVADALAALDADPGCRAVVLTSAGSKAFAAGADIKELATQSSASLHVGGRFGAWDRIATVGVPVIAAVRGFALGGGCELAMTCDMIVAGDDAVFGQPEILIGVMPGAGGTQRLTRAVGQARAMELILTGRTITAHEAETMGLVTRVVPAEATLEAAMELAVRIASMPPLAVRAAKRAIRLASESPLADGLAAEREAFFALFDTADQAEGMRAFTEKRAPVWTGR